MYYVLCTIMYYVLRNKTCAQSIDDVTLLGVMIDKKLTFEKYIDYLVLMAQYKPHALRCIRKFLTIEKAKTLCNRQLIQLCTFNMDVLWENILF